VQKTLTEFWCHHDWDQCLL